MPLPRPSAVPLQCCSSAAAGLIGMVLLVVLSAMQPARAQADPRLSELERRFRAGNTAEALAATERAVASAPGDAGIRFLLAVMLAESGREAEAVDHFERLSQEFPELPEPFNNLAVLAAARGQLDKARLLLEAALRNDPGYRAAHQNLGDVYLRLAAKAYESAAQGPRPDDAVSRKLQLTRQLLDAVAVAPVGR